jgi:hypothetical protein
LLDLKPFAPFTTLIRPFGAPSPAGGRRERHAAIANVGWTEEKKEEKEEKE